MHHNFMRPSTGGFKGVKGAAAAAALAASLLMALPHSTAYAQESPESFDSQLPAPGNNVEDLDQLLARMGKLADDTAAKSEEVKQKQDELNQANEELRRLEEAAANAGVDAGNAADAVAKQRQAVQKLAGSRYRGVNFDHLTTALASGDPQLAAERLGYLGALSRAARANLATMNHNANSAEDKLSSAQDAADMAEKKRNEIGDGKAALEREAQELEKLRAEVERRVDSFGEEERKAWENRLNPVDPAKVDGSAAGNLSSVVSAALSKQGSPYGWGAAGPSEFDCSGLMYWAYQQVGKTIPRTSQAQIAGGTPVSTDDLQPGDIVGYYPGVTYVGMYIGNGQVVHASTYGVPVQVVPVDSMPISGAARF